MEILNEENFTQKVENVNGVVLVDFFATWCGPCRMLAPVLEQVAEETEATIYKVDIDKCQNLAQALGISSVPAILYIPLDGEPAMTIGSRDKARFKSEIESMLLKK